MPYTSQPEIEAKIPVNILNDALDDDADGTADDGVLAQVIANADGEVDGLLAGHFPVPFADPVPAKVKAASFAFTCEAIYQRRSIPDEKNPFNKIAQWWREHLQKVGNAEIPLDVSADTSETPGDTSSNPPGAAIIENNTLDGSLR